jgi:hypothetical protein
LAALPVVSGLEIAMWTHADRALVGDFGSRMKPSCCFARGEGDVEAEFVELAGEPVQEPKMKRLIRLGS